MIQMEYNIYAVTANVCTALPLLESGNSIIRHNFPRVTYGGDASKGEDIRT